MSSPKPLKPFRPLFRPRGSASRLKSSVSLSRLDSVLDSLAITVLYRILNLDNEFPVESISARTYVNCHI